MKKKRKYEFSWDLIGDIELGRPNLGKMTRIEMYRLLQFTFRDIIEQKVGAEQTDAIFYESGKLAGKEFYKHMVPEVKDIDDFIRQLQKVLKELGVGILRIEELNMEKMEVILTISEDLDCSGIPESGGEICTYDEGFLSALLECYFDLPFQVKEIDCWCTGDRNCRFQAKAIELEMREEL